jgi:predicted nucleic acid-binding protein
MTFKAFFDTNVLAYEYDLRNLKKQSVAKNLLDKWRASDNFVISTQVLQELYVVLTKKLISTMSGEEAEEIITTYSVFNVVTVTTETILRAIKIKKRYKLSFWDSVIVSAAVDGKCRILFTEDLSDGMKIEGIKIVNPFKEYV